MHVTERLCGFPPACTSCRSAETRPLPLSKVVLFFHIHLHLCSASSFAQHFVIRTTPPIALSILSSVECAPYQKLSLKVRTLNTRPAIDHAIQRGPQHRTTVSVERRTSSSFNDMTCRNAFNYGGVWEGLESDRLIPNCLLWSFPSSGGICGLFSPPQ